MLDFLKVSGILRRQELSPSIKRRKAGQLSESEIAPAARSLSAVLLRLRVGPPLRLPCCIALGALAGAGLAAPRSPPPELLRPKGTKFMLRFAPLGLKKNR